MNRFLAVAAVANTLLGTSSVGFAQVPAGTAITFQGQIKQGGVLLNGTADLSFAIYDAATGGSLVGNSVSLTNTTITNGQISSPLDFGIAPFSTSSARWMQVSIRSPAGVGSYTLLSPRQAITAAPYALGLRLPLTENISTAGSGAAVTLNNSGSGGYSFLVSAPDTGVAFRGSAGNGYAFLGSASGPGGVAVSAEHDSTSGLSPAVYAVTFSNTGGAPAVRGEGAGTGSIGVLGQNDASGNSGLIGTDSCGVHGQQAPTGNYGELGTSIAGVSGVVPGANGNAAAVRGTSASPQGYGVFALNTSTGTEGHLASGGAGVYGKGGAIFPPYAGYFEGTVYATVQVASEYLFANSARINGHVLIENGDLDVEGGSKNFKIDHPLDPEHRYLYHASVESPELKNLYDGLATLDDRGEGIVVLPDWFEALNGEFRYQLTSIGAPGPNLYIGHEVEHNRFTIAGGKPGQRVSWQVTGVRHDAWAAAHPFVVDRPKAMSDTDRIGVAPHVAESAGEVPAAHATDCPAPAATP